MSTRWGRRLLWAGLILVAVLTGGFFLISYLIEEVWQDAAAEADRLDPGWRLEDLEAHRAAVPDDQNGALIADRGNRAARITREPGSVCGVAEQPVTHGLILANFAEPGASATGVWKVPPVADAPGSPLRLNFPSHCQIMCRRWMKTARFTSSQRHRT